MTIQASRRAKREPAEEGRLSVSMPEGMKQWVDEQVKIGRYRSASHYLCDLILRDQKAARHLIEELDKGKASGVSTRQVPDIVREAKARLRKHGKLSSIRGG